MTDFGTDNRLPGLFHYRWSVPVLAGLHELGGAAKFVSLQRRIGAGRESLKRTLLGLTDAGLVGRNPGYGHPLRPEYLLSDRGRKIAPQCAMLIEALRALGIEELGLRKWSLPLTHVLDSGGGRFNAVLAALGAITPRALAQALRDMQDAGLVERRLIDDHPPRTEYLLTRRGRRLAPIMRDLAGARPTRHQSTRQQRD